MYKNILKIVVSLLILSNISVAKSHYASNANNLEQTIVNLSNKLMNSCRVDQNSLEDIAVTSFVNLEDFKKTSKIGRILSESMLNELFARNFDIIDFRGQSAISINKSGTYFISRDIDRLRNVVRNKYVLVGTYSVFDTYILINVRIIDNVNGKIVASAREHYNTQSCKLTNTCKPKRSSMKEFTIISERKLRMSASKKL